MAAAFPEVHGVTTFLEAPEGYVVNFEHPQERHVLDHYLIFGVLGLLALVCLVQRLYTKHFISGGLKVDDCRFSCRKAPGWRGVLKLTLATYRFDHSGMDCFTHNAVCPNL